MIEMVIDANELNLYSTPAPPGVPQALSYSDIVNSIGGQIVDRFLVLGAVFLIYSYWNKCGMRRDFNGSWDSYPKRLMVNLFKERAEHYTDWINGFLDGLTSSLAFVAIAMWLMYQLGW